MKAKNKVKRLEARIQDFKSTFPSGRTSKGFDVHCPGSLKK